MPVTHDFPFRGSEIHLIEMIRTSSTDRAQGDWGITYTIMPRAVSLSLDSSPPPFHENLEFGCSQHARWGPYSFAYPMVSHSPQTGP
jgi:hypothetical protein